PDIDKTVVANAVTRMVQDGTIPQNAGISSESWENAVKIRHQIGDIKNIKQTEKAVDNSFAENSK
ncbi:MAG: ABC transporter substrate-binding protein, partial [Chitinophagaceae bacterium]|nr:ABC transporter substrate-binding protein [Chitinophagaceae bacterium]